MPASDTLPCALASERKSPQPSTAKGSTENHCTPSLRPRPLRTSRLTGGAEQPKGLILAKHQPALGLLLQQQLDAAGLDCQSELMPWPRDRMLQAMAVAATVVILAPPEGEAAWANGVFRPWHCKPPL